MQESGESLGTGRTRRPHAERRAEIAGATLKVMAEHGLTGATNSRIAAEVGLSGPALYGHFANRMEVLVAAMDVLMERIAKWLALSTNPNMLERLRELGESHADFMATEVEGFVLPSFEFIVSPRSLGLGPLFGAKQAEMIQAIAKFVEEGKVQGSIRSDVDSKMVAWELVVIAWAEDVARLAGLDDFITDGTSVKILKVLLDDIAAPDLRSETAASSTT